MGDRHAQIHLAPIACSRCGGETTGGIESHEPILHAPAFRTPAPAANLYGSELKESVRGVDHDQSGCDRLACECQAISARLTPKEKKILSLTVEGCNVHQIALRLDTSEQVIRNYLRCLTTLTGTADQAELANFTVAHHMLELSSAA